MASLLKMLGQPRFGLMVAMLLLVAGLLTQPVIAQDEGAPPAEGDGAAPVEGSGGDGTGSAPDASAAAGSVGRADGDASSNSSSGNSTGVTFIREPGYICAVLAAVLLMAPRINPLQGLLAGVGSTSG